MENSMTWMYCTIQHNITDNAGEAETHNRPQLAVDRGGNFKTSFKFQNQLQGKNFLVIQPESKSIYLSLSRIGLGLCWF